MIPLSAESDNSYLAAFSYEEMEESSHNAVKQPEKATFVFPPPLKHATRWGVHEFMQPLRLTVESRGGIE